MGNNLEGFGSLYMTFAPFSLHSPGYQACSKMLYSHNYPNASSLVDELFDLAHLGDRRQDMQTGVLLALRVRPSSSMINCEQGCFAFLLSLITS